MSSCVTPVGSATVGLSQANYSLIEGGDPVSICLVVVSVIGQVTETVFVGLSVSIAPQITGEFNFEGAEVGDEILCQMLSLGDDNVVDQQPDAPIFSFIEASPAITFAPERDTAILIFVDNDRTYVSYGKFYPFKLYI